MRAVSASASASDRPGGATIARQLARSSAMPDSRSVGASMPAHARGRRDREHAQLAGGDLSGELRVAADRRRELSAEHRGERGAAAGERDVVDARCRQSDLFGQQPHQQIVGAARRSAAPRHAAGILLERGDQIAERSIRARRGHDDDFVFAGEARDRRGVGERDRRAVEDHAAHHHQAGDQQRAGIAALALDEARQADRAGGAGHVVDLHADAGLDLREHALHRARGLIPAAARRRRRGDHERLCERLDERGDAAVTSTGEQSRSAGSAPTCHLPARIS